MWSRMLAKRSCKSLVITIDKHLIAQVGANSGAEGRLVRRDMDRRVLVMRR